jgi:hypothetical protein
VRKGEAQRKGIKDLQFYRDGYFTAPEMAAPLFRHHRDKRGQGWRQRE